MFLHIGNGANCCLDIYHWGTVVMVVLGEYVTLDRMFNIPCSKLLTQVSR